MGLLDFIMGRRVTPNPQRRSQLAPRVTFYPQERSQASVGNAPYSDDKPVIRVDPSCSLPDSPGRPPIIFENGLS